MCFAYELAKDESTVCIEQSILTSLSSQFGVFVLSNAWSTSAESSHSTTIPPLTKDIGTHLSIKVAPQGGWNMTFLAAEAAMDWYTSPVPVVNK